jgi:tetratricopeptide (TPR) repeat protein
MQKRILELDPLSPMQHANLGFYYYLTRQWELAIRQYHNALKLDPNYYFAHLNLSLVYIQNGKLDDAINSVKKATQFIARSPYDLGYLGYVYAVKGQIIEAEKILEELELLSQEVYVMPSSFSHICLGLGQIDQAFDWLEKAVNTLGSQVLYSLISPRYDPLRSDHRYKALLRKMNLEPWL